MKENLYGSTREKNLGYCKKVKNELRSEPFGELRNEMDNPQPSSYGRYFMRDYGEGSETIMDWA